MKNEEAARSFWKRVDELWGNDSLKELARKSNVDYVLFLNWRTKHRLPDLISACNIAQNLDTSVEYLSSGSNTLISPFSIQDIMERLITASAEERNMIRRLLGIVIENPPENKNHKPYGHGS